MGKGAVTREQHSETPADERESRRGEPASAIDGGRRSHDQADDQWCRIEGDAQPSGPIEHRYVTAPTARTPADRGMTASVAHAAVIPEVPSTWLKADRLHTLVPRESARWRKLYRRRGAVERGFGRLKGEWALLPLRVRGLDRVRLHADLTILAQLATALAKARAVPLAA